MLFAYPVVAVKVVQVFACHEVEGSSFLRADYSAECYTGQWNGMVVYASVWIAVYVIGLPLFVLRQLLSHWYHQKPPSASNAATSSSALEKSFLSVVRRISAPVTPSDIGGNKGGNTSRGRVRLAFLADDDYKAGLPTMLWEVLEMLRKLLLSVIGAFW